MKIHSSELIIKGPTATRNEVVKIVYVTVNYIAGRIAESEKAHIKNRYTPNFTEKHVCRLVHNYTRECQNSDDKAWDHIYSFGCCQPFGNLEANSLWSIISRV